jgi:L-malate glycosyltransferase
MTQPPRIIAFHLLNDRSGSPKVLSQLIKGWVESGLDVQLYTSLHQNGFLSDLEGVHYHQGWYRFRKNPWVRLLFYTLSQILLFVKMFGRLKSSDIIYINTVLPFGAAYLGKLKGCRVIYHIHESTVHPSVLKWFLFKTVAWTASDIINVSEFVQEAHHIRTVPNHLVYNAIEDEYMAKVTTREQREKPSNVLMVCSLKTYKGVWEFWQLSKDFPDYHFRLVLNASGQDIEAFFARKERPLNLMIYSTQKDMHPFYRWADVILNLSRPDGWIETFGLTIIEGMAYGLPAIVPPIGGILEVLDEGLSGYAVDSRDRQGLQHCLHQLLSNPDRYRAHSEAALSRGALFREGIMLQKVQNILLQS